MFLNLGFGVIFADFAKPAKQYHSVTLAKDSGGGGTPLTPIRAWALRALAPFESHTHVAKIQYQKIWILPKR
ncbi:hypothetical protein KKF47_01450, partial [Patescibacteria group bacterium]|nr:hypothetical protein [Patescibacteria group bacterium]